MVADAYFSKKEVVDTMLSLGLHFISRLRSDSNLKYKFTGEQVEWFNTKNKKNSQLSISDYKSMYNNELLLKTFIERFGIKPNTKKNKNIIVELRNWGKIAA